MKFVAYRPFLKAGLLVTLLLTTILAAPAVAAPHLCLPPLYEGGQRLHELPSPRVYWLDPLLRQHELCWRSLTRPDELRVLLVGSSAVFGFPWPVEQTFGSLLNQHFADQQLPARLYNLAWVNPYQVRDALILHDALAYDPDVVIYPVTMAEFIHIAPVMWPALVNFFDRNRNSLADLAANPPPGLTEPLALYGEALERRQEIYSRMDWLRELGTLVRTSVQRHAHNVAERLSPVPLPSTAKTKGRQTEYDCTKTHMTLATDYRDWRDWNILGYLEKLHQTRGIGVLIVNWPIAHEPIDDCYNVRFSNKAVDEFDRWLREQAAARGFAYLDLHDLLRPEQFLDSAHVLPAGHREIAARISAELDPMLQELLAQRASGEERHRDTETRRPPAE